MSRGIKALWIVIGSIFAVGVILAAIGFALGGSGSLWWSKDGIHFGTRDVTTVEYAESDTAAFSALDVRLIESDVEIVSSDSYGYSFTYTGAQTPVIEVSGNTLRVVEETDSFPIRIMGLWDVFEAISSQSKLTVYVPEAALLDTVTLYTASGDTHFEGNHFSIGTLDYKSASGGMNLSNLTLDTLILDVASGDVNVSEVAAKSASFNIMSGWLTYEGASLESLDLNMASGDATITGEITSFIKLQMVSGDVDLNLKGNEEDYSYEIERISGDILINGRAVTESSIPGSSSGGNSAAPGRIEVSLTSGSVNINFS